MAIKFNQGSDKSFFLKFKSKKTGYPIDFTDLKAVDVKMKKTDSTILTLTLGVGVAIEGDNLLGTLKVTLTEAQSVLVKEGAGDLEVRTEIGSALAGDAANDVQWYLFPGEMQIGKRKLV